MNSCKPRHTNVAQDEPTTTGMKIPREGWDELAPDDDEQCHIAAFRPENIARSEIIFETITEVPI